MTLQSQVQRSLLHSYYARYLALLQARGVSLAVCALPAAVCYARCWPLAGVRPHAKADEIWHNFLRGAFGTMACRRFNVPPRYTVVMPLECAATLHSGYAFCTRYLVVCLMKFGWVSAFEYCLLSPWLFY